MSEDKSTVNHDDSTGIITSNTPVPVKLSLPATMFPDGVVKSSKSPCRVASDMNEAVVSYDALESIERSRYKERKRD